MDRIIDDEYEVIREDISKVQRKPSMYISYTGTAAVLHLMKEIINNSIDEHDNPNSISDGIITILHNKETGMTYVQDSGRGIPFNELENACTILHAGTKMLRQSGTTAGENGVGLTATNALSEVFEITSYRDGKMKFMQFQEGVKVIDKESKIRTNKHGLLVGFKPSTIYLGKCELPIDELDEWLLKQSFFISPDIKIKLTVQNKGTESSSNKTYKNTQGIGGFLAKLSPEFNLMKTPVVFSSHDTIMENDIPTHGDNGEVELIDIMRTIDLEVAINYSSEKIIGDAGVRYSFCNNIETIEHGEHVNGVTNAFVTFMKKEVKKASKKNDEKDVTNNDVLSGLGLVIDFRTDYSSSVFTSQTKHKVGNRIFYEPIKKMTLKALENHFKLPDNKRTLSKLIAIVNENIKIRHAATKAKKKVIKEGPSLMDSKLIKGYTAPNNLEEEGAYREIFIVEGESAGNTARTGRYSTDVQGILGLMGKPSNAYGESYANIAKNAPDIHRLFDEILRCGYGNHFNINNLIYDKIIIMPDADVDGGHIFGLITSNIYAHARDLITEGKVYKAVMPLYKLTGIDGNDIYTYSKSQYFDVYVERASEYVMLKFDMNDDFISKDNMKRFLETNRPYGTWLETMSGFYTLHPDIIEFMAANENFREIISELGPELKYDSKNDSINGIYDGNFYSIIIDDVFVDGLSVLTKGITEGNNGIYKYYVYKQYKTKKEPEYIGYMTIGQIMTLCSQYEPQIQERYKGLGEFNKVEMNELVMNPYNRKLIKLTLSDIEDTNNLMNDLFLKSHRGQRKKMIQDLHITVDDIDN